jgi:hypothetical protein
MSLLNQNRKLTLVWRKWLASAAEEVDEAEADGVAEVAVVVVAVCSSILFLIVN